MYLFIIVMFQLSSQLKEAVQKMNTHVVMDSVFQKDGCVIAIGIAKMVVMREAVVRSFDESHTRHTRGG